MPAEQPATHNHGPIRRAAEHPPSPTPEHQIRRRSGMDQATAEHPHTSLRALRTPGSPRRRTHLIRPDRSRWRGLTLDPPPTSRTPRIRSVERRLDAHAAKSQPAKRLRSTPGIGPRLSEIVVAMIDDPHRFKNGKQVAAYAGLVPRVFQSGSVDRKGRITGAGNRYLRSILIEVSWLGLRTNPWMKQVFDRVCRGCPSRRKIAIVAVARRLLIWCWAMMRDDRNWDPKTALVAA